MSQHIGRACRVFWKNDDEWFDGLVDDYHPENGWHVQYFDGDDEWLQQLDPKIIQFDDDDANSIGKASLGNTSLQSNGEDEIVILNIVQAEHELSDSDNEGRLNNSNIKSSPERLMVAPYNTHISENNQLSGRIDEGRGEDEDVRSETQDDGEVKSVGILPERGVLLLGSVTGASNLPNGDGGVFFRVLYVEGGLPSSMFRCKTPIFTSTIMHNNPCFPSWAKGSFRLEMTVPEQSAALTANPTKLTSNKQSHPQARIASRRDETHSDECAFLRESSSFMPSGELLIVVYRERQAGGSDYLGQCSFDLQELARGGVPQRHAIEIECRSLAGSYPLTNRSGSSTANDLAHLDVTLELSWKVPHTSTNGSCKHMTNSDAADSTPKNKAIGDKTTTSKNRSSTSVAESAVPTAASGTSKVAKKKQVPTNQSSASNASRRNRTEQLRIERENKSLQARLASQKSKHPTKHKSIIPPTDVYAIDAQPKKSPEELAGITPSFLKQINSLGAAELLTLRNSLIKDAALNEKTTKELRATNTRLRLQVSKYTLAIEKFKKSGAILPIDSKIALGADAKPAIKFESKDSSIKLELLDADERAGSKEEQELRSEVKHQSKDTESNAELRKGTGKGRLIADSAQLDADPVLVESEATSDSELKELLIEHQALQEMRRGMVERIMMVQTMTKKFMHSIHDAARRDELARLRIDGISARLSGNKGK